MEIVGKIVQVLPAQEGVSKSTGNPWKIQSYILETLEQYPRKVCFEIFGEDRIKNNPCEIDQIVTVSFDIESREFNGRWYTSIRAWRVQQGDTTANAADQPVAPGAPAAASATQAQSAEPMTGNVQTFDAAASQDDGTDLPF
ncbi:MAG: DUF3127 domain-containing protein [Paludibacteraceae bacterium]|nr:DUF3127 domain-containing protein [Paludibacteraceae bacterium]